jgi:hypothetical protein
MVSPSYCNSCEIDYNNGFARKFVRCHFQGMKFETLQRPDAETGNKFSAVDKVGFGQLFDVSKRTVDAWLAAGLPHLKLSSRMVRIPLVEASQWVREKYLTQRRAVAE